jgi:hypothetical protein
MSEQSGMKEETATNKFEQQIQRWSLGLDAVEGVDAERSGALLEMEIKPFIAVSTEIGAGAAETIDQVNEKLDFDVVERAVFDYLADRYKLSRDMLEIVDEKVCNWLVEAVGIWLAQRMISQSEYMSLLARFVLMAARSANTIFVGRGVRFILPREKGLAIRFVAPLEQRIERVMNEQQLNRRDAKRNVTKRDTEQRQFIRHHYRCDISDPVQYDIVINTENIALDDAAEIVKLLWHERFVDPVSAGDNSP